MYEEASSLEELRDIIGDCRRCGLSHGRANIVFGAGNPDAELMFVGEGPGRHEDQQGLPFVGPAGRILDNMLNSIGLTRDDVYIANVVKCRPPNNRDPLPEEIRACGPFVERQIKIIKPRIVCELGRIAASLMLNRQVPIMRVHGQRIPGPCYFHVPVLHPAAAIRSTANMEHLEHDFRMLKRYLEEPAEPPGPVPCERKPAAGDGPARGPGDEDHGGDSFEPEQLSLF